MFSGLRSYLWLGGAVALAILAIAIKIHLSADTKIREENESLKGWRGEVVIAVQEAAENPRVTKDTAIGQIRALGESNRLIKVELVQQNETIDEMARQAVKLKARATELKRIADKAEAQRVAALTRLSDLSITPGTREDCMTLLREAEEALNLVYEADK